MLFSNLFRNFDFNVIDIETAYSFRDICQIGVACVRNSVIVRSKSWLVRPQRNMYDEESIAKHGITPEMTENAPDLVDIWNEVFDFLNGSDIIVCHNASFDMSRLYSEVRGRNLNIGNFKVFCSLAIANKNNKYGAENAKLEVLCSHFGISSPKWHDAKYDAEATAKLFLKELEIANVATIEELQQKYNFECSNFCERNSIDGKNNEYEPRPSLYRFSGQVRTRANQFVGDPTKTMPEHPLYKKKVVVTGYFKYSREDILQYLADIGAIAKDNISKSLDYFITGSEAGPSKVQKFTEYNSMGCNITLITKEMFEEMIEKYKIS